MNYDQKKQDRVRELKVRRMQLAEEKARAEKRVRLGEQIVTKINLSLQKTLSLAEFDSSKKLTVGFDRRSNFKDCPGLVAAHTSEIRLREILTCCEKNIGVQAGVIGFEEYEFIGMAHLESISLLQILDLAKSLHDSVLFYPDGCQSIILVDHYKVMGVPQDVHFSLIVQGEKLEHKLKSCFSASPITP